MCTFSFTILSLTELSVCGTVFDPERKSTEIHIVHMFWVRNVPA